MAISHTARYCNGFPNLVSNTEGLSRSIQSIHSCSFLWFPGLSGHKSGHNFSKVEAEALSAKGVGLSNAKWVSNQQGRGGADTVIKQMNNGQWC